MQKSGNNDYSLFWILVDGERYLLSGRLTPIDPEPRHCIVFERILDEGQVVKEIMNMAVVFWLAVLGVFVPICSSKPTNQHEVSKVICLVRVILIQLIQEVNLSGNPAELQKNMPFDV